MTFQVKQVISKLCVWFSKFERGWVSLIFLVAFGLFSVGLSAPLRTERDGYYRFQGAMYALKKHDYFPVNGSVWLPLHTSFMMLPQALFPSSQLAPRVATLFVASFIPVLLYLLTLRLANQRLAAVLVAALYIAYPFSFYFSSSTLSEPVFLALLLLSQYFFLEKKYWQFGLGMLFCQAIRFEAWFLIPWYMLEIWLIKLVSLKVKILVSVLLIFFPLLYSGGGLIKERNATPYYSQMSAMVSENAVSGIGNFPLAVSSWNLKILEATPLTLLLLIAIGLWVFYQRVSETKDIHSEEILNFVTAPLFLIFMLYVQVFLKLRDWLPIRYTFIPIVLLFPVLGLGLKWLFRKLPIKTFWSYYVLIGLFMIFEFYSQALNTKILMETYLPNNFSQIHSMINEIKRVSGSKQIESIQLLNTENKYLDRAFFYYFLLPQRVFVTNINLTELPEILKKKTKNSLLITESKNINPKINLPIFLKYGEYIVYQVGDFN